MSGELQFGFRKGMDTKKIIFYLQIAAHMCPDHRETYFVDFEKAFNWILYKTPIELLENTKDIKELENIFRNQETTIRIRVGVAISANMVIKEGVLQEYFLYAKLFDVSEMIFSWAINDITQEINKNGVNLNNIRYVDDTVSIADSDVNIKTVWKPGKTWDEN